MASRSRRLLGYLLLYAVTAVCVGAALAMVMGGDG